MKQSTIEKLMKIWGWFTLVVLILGIPAQFINKYLLNMEFESTVLIMFVISSLFEMILAVAFIRCKKDLFLVIAMGGQVLYRIISFIMNFSLVSVLDIISTVIYIAIYILFLLFVAVNCIEKFSIYRTKINEFWFSPSALFAVISVTNIISAMEKKVPYSVKNNVQEVGTETIVQSFSLLTGVSSSLLSILPYFLLCYWLYKSCKIEIETE